MNDDSFVEIFGLAQPATQSARLAVRLNQLSSGKSLLAEIGAGVFCKGFISVASTRDDLPSLGGWQRWLPKDAFLYATTAFGILYVADREKMWLVNTQAGSILPTGYDLHEAVDKAASETVREDLLHFSVFQNWVEIHGELKSTEILQPAVPLVKGGRLAVDSLERTDLTSYLKRSRRLFADQGRAAISIMPAGDD